MFQMLDGRPPRRKFFAEVAVETFPFDPSHYLYNYPAYGLSVFVLAAEHGYKGFPTSFKWVSQWPLPTTQI